jgi:hypothetical protein
MLTNDRMEGGTEPEKLPHTETTSEETPIRKGPAERVHDAKSYKDAIVIASYLLLRRCTPEYVNAPAE